MSIPRARTPHLKPMHRGQLPAFCCRHARVDGLQRPSGRPALPKREPHHHHVADREPPRPWTEISMGARAHTNAIAPAPAPRQAHSARPYGPPSG